jgi:predicted dehydrogenase
MKTVRFGVMGLGVVGTRHLQTFARAGGKDFRLTAALEANPQSAERARQNTGVPIYTDLDAFLAAGLCDAVVVAAPHCWHPYLTIRAARAGLHVLCEKPLAVTVGAARAMIDECRRHKVALGAMLQDRGMALYARMKRMIDSGRIGRVYRISQVCTRWYRTQAYYDSGAWRGTWDGEGGGILINQACHALDIFQWLGGMPDRVMCCLATRIHRIEVENTAEAVFHYADGRMGHFYVSTAQEPALNRIEVFGDKGTLVAEGGKLMFARLACPLSRHILTCPIAEADVAKIGSSWQEVKLPARAAGTHEVVIRAFARHILHGEPMVAPGEEAINELELSNAMYLSGHENRSVDLPVDAAKIERLLDKLEKERSTGKGSGQRRAANAALRKLIRKWGGHRTPGGLMPTAAGQRTR